MEKILNPPPQQNIVSFHQVIITALSFIEMCSVFGFYLRVFQYKLLNGRLSIKLVHDWEKGDSFEGSVVDNCLTQRELRVVFHPSVHLFFGVCNGPKAFLMLSYMIGHIIKQLHLTFLTKPLKLKPFSLFIQSLFFLHQKDHFHFHFYYHTTFCSCKQVCNVILGVLQDFKTVKLISFFYFMRNSFFIVLFTISRISRYRQQYT